MNQPDPTAQVVAAAEIDAANARTALYVLADEYAVLRSAKKNLQERVDCAEAVVAAAREFLDADWVTDTSIENLRDAMTAYDAHQTPAALDSDQLAPLVMIRRDRAERLIRFARACDDFPGGFANIDWTVDETTADDEAIEELRDAWDAIKASDLWMP
jgi:hypothetical protein